MTAMPTAGGPAWRKIRRTHDRSMVRRGLTALMAVLIIVTGCTPALQPMGPPVTTPAIVGDTVVTTDGTTLPLRVWMPSEGRAAATRNRPDDKRVLPIRASVDGLPPDRRRDARDTGDPKAVIIALHGLNDYSNAFADPAAYWARNGIATYAYDQRGFGATDRPGIWAGTQTLVADLAATVTAVRSRHPGVPVYLLGESMGGAVIMVALARAGTDGYPALDVDGAILSAPAVWARETMPTAYRAALWVGYTVVPWMQVRPPRNLNIIPSDNIEMLRRLGADPLVLKRTRIDMIRGLTDLMGEALSAAARLETPALVLYGAHEQIVPEEPVRKALTLLTREPHTVAVYDNGYHMLLRDLQGPTVWEDILSWITASDAPLPSGAEHFPHSATTETTADAAPATEPPS